MNSSVYVVGGGGLLAPGPAFVTFAWWSSIL